MRPEHVILDLVEETSLGQVLDFAGEVAAVRRRFADAVGPPGATVHAARVVDFLED
jgi:hypothetical protein